VAGFGAAVVAMGAAVVAVVVTGAAVVTTVVTGAAVVTGAFGGVSTFDEPHPTNTSMSPAAKAEAMGTDLFTMKLRCVEGLPQSRYGPSESQRA
jgi:hypothetical protein